MYRDERGPAGPNSRPQGTGSVRRARERMNAQFDFENPGGYSEPQENRRMPVQRPVEPQRTSPAQRRQGPVPVALNLRDTPGGIGAAISRPTPVAQNAPWPLQQENSRAPVDSNISAARGPPPQRPPRPSHVPSLLDSSKIQDYTPSFPNRQPQQQEPPPSNQVLSPFYESSSSSSTSPHTPNRYSSDRPSTSSSAGSIPDFPIPAPIGQMGSQRRQPPPGPPPVRRGPSSYYSHASFVSPIPEEMPESLRGGGSLASSRAIPSSWGSRPDNFNIDDYEDDIAEESPTIMGSPGSSQHSEAGLVRQASLGKKAKPTLRTIVSSDEVPTSSKKQNPDARGVVGRALVAAGAAGGVAAAGFGGKDRTGSPETGNRTLMVETSSSESDIPKVASSPDADTGTGMGRMPSLSEKRPDARRPPRLNMNAVRDAEARGSLTSLPDLIRRATRLASNLDRGRTASRLGMLDMLNAEARNSPSPLIRELKIEERRRSGSISDILASFPPPALGTPTGERERERPISQWPTPFSPSKQQQYYNEKDISSDGNKSAKRGRRCCGMRLPVFLLLMVVLFLLIAAAVVVPIVFLIILPRMRNASAGSAAADTSPDACASSNMCQNNGVEVFQSNQCRCVCVNGFTGSTCAVARDASCTTFQQGSTSNATVGDAIPRLLSTSSANFSIPLDNQDILSLFSFSNLSCTTENAIVTFNTQSSKRFYIPPVEPTWAPEDLVIPVVQARNVLMPHGGTPVIQTRDLQEDLSPRQGGAVATTNGILYQPQPTSAADSTQGPTTIATSQAATTTSSASNSPSGLNLTSDVIDFARLVVLFVLDQTNQLDSAVSAQEKIQNFFSGTMSSMRMPMGMMSGQNFTLNFSDFSILLQNGTVVGGKGNGNGGLVNYAQTQGSG